MKPARFLIIPCVKAGRGSGHILRSLALRRSLAQKGAEARLLLGRAGKGDRESGELTRAFSIGPEEWLDEPRAREGNWDLIVFDNFSTGREFFERFRRRGFCVGIDEGGEARPAFDYLIDIMPRLKREYPPNTRDALAFLDLPPIGREFPQKIRKILVSMGGEDAKGLGLKIARRIMEIDPAGLYEADLVKGALSRYPDRAPEGLRVLPAMPNLKSRLKDYDLAICQFGLTAYEALASGTGVLLFNPSSYHEALSKAAGFPSLGALRFDKKLLADFLSHPQRLFDATRMAKEKLAAALARAPQAQGPTALADFLLSMDLPGLSPSRACVACPAEKRKGRGEALWRDGSRSYFRCPSCGSVRMARVGENAINYDESYFFEEYRRQYGKTYLEDFPALRRMARDRLEKIKNLTGSLEGKRVLDIGCAYGAFLQEAKESGCSVFGIDPAEEAVEYLRVKLGIGALQGFFPDKRLAEMAKSEAFDIVSMWYVAEHLPDLNAALASVRGLLRPGGILALSTPSASGVSARFSKENFYRSSPMDHQTILSPSSSKRIFSESGFRFLAARTTGQHPERFPFRHRVTGGLKYDMLFAASRLFALGDTFEAYASRI
jgi:2-polyprenyl-3-methyl-5-hydroxy-6-metoxy-1,4-benzoquinol methylase/spore coat polysaccharide biosynthesis predicted glycosyltransferase SpsG